MSKHGFKVKKKERKSVQLKQAEVFVFKNEVSRNFLSLNLFRFDVIWFGFVVNFIFRV